MLRIANKLIFWLQDISIPLSFTCKGPGVIHGVACWFDVKFPGTAQPMWLSTAPGMAATHWFQLRCVFQVTFQNLLYTCTFLKLLEPSVHMLLE